MGREAGPKEEESLRKKAGESQRYEGRKAWS